MKPIHNFREHPSLKYDVRKSVFAIEKKLYLYSEESVGRILPMKVQMTTIGDPFRKLARFVFVDGEEEDSIDLDIEYVFNLVLMCGVIGIKLPVSKELEKLCVNR